MADSPWRDRLRPASFRGAAFHVEIGSRASGRRLALHEFPKRDVPYVEDMGRKARLIQITGYCVGPDYQDERDDLVDQLEREGPGLLIHPTFGEFLAHGGISSEIERRERGGFVEIEMQFLEAGADVPFSAEAATQDQVKSQAGIAQDALVTGGNGGLAELRDPSRPLTGGGA